MTHEQANAPRLTGRLTAAICAGLLLLFALLSYSAVSTKCATTDEVIHAPSAYTHLRYWDYRCNPEHPPLWKYWAALPWLASPPADMNLDSPEYAGAARDPTDQWKWAQNTLYRTPGNDPVKLVGMCRAMMLVFGIGLGALLAWWGWRLGGAVAAIVACTLYALDPNFLAHAALMTNDVIFTLQTLGIAYLTWRVGQRITVLRVGGLGVLCGVTLATKYTAVLAGPTVAITLVIRALLPEQWPWSDGALRGRGQRLLAAVAICLVCALVSYVLVWAAYGFRFRTSPDPRVHPDLAAARVDAIAKEIEGTTGHGANERDIREWRPSLYITGSLWGIDHHILPEPFLYGLLFAYANSLYRWSYLFGEITGRGHWYYFPVAMAVKTPLATLAAIALALVLGLALREARKGRGFADGVWLWICLGVPFVLIGYASIRSHMNIGIRHVFALYPLMFLAVAVLASRAWARWPRLVRGVVLGLGIVLAAESCAAWPNYIPFFNAAVGGYRGGFYIVGDSNLDWGQDLPLLAEWQKQHPDRTLWLAYFGTAVPEYYGIKYKPLTIGNDFMVTRKVFPTTGVVAASATMLQTTWLRPEAQTFFSSLRQRKPTEILGGSIYVYDLGGD